jgi:hypothetical protein
MQHPVDGTLHSVERWNAKNINVDDGATTRMQAMPTTAGLGKLDTI